MCYMVRISDQNGVSVLDIMLEIHHSGREPTMSSLSLELEKLDFDSTVSKS